MTEGLQRESDAVAWGVASGRQPRFPAVLAVLFAVALQVTLPQRLIRGLGSRGLIPCLEVALMVVLLIARPGSTPRHQSWLRIIGVGLIALITAANAVSLVELLHALLHGSNADGRGLIYASLPIWLTNIVVFGLWYWELDRGGPAARERPAHPRPDFLFPQMSTPGSAPGWTPGFVDYLYTSFTNATSFGPTDTMPLTVWSKLLMMLQTLVSLVTLVVVISRAVSILR